MISNVDNTSGAGEALNTGFDKVNLVIDRVNEFDALSVADIAQLDVYASVALTSTELNILDGATVTTAELNRLDGDLATVRGNLGFTDQSAALDVLSLAVQGDGLFDLFYLKTTIDATFALYLSEAQLKDGSQTLDLEAIEINNVSFVDGSRNVSAGTITANSGGVNKVAEFISEDQFAQIFLSDSTTTNGEVLRRNGDELSIYTGGVNAIFLNATGKTFLNAGLAVTGNASITGTLDVDLDATFGANVQSDAFSSGWLADGGVGFGIQKVGTQYNAEFNDLLIRGRLKVFELIVKQIATLGGTEIMSVAVAEADSVTGSAGSEVVTITDPRGFGGTSLAANDLCIVQRVDINDSTIVKQEFRTVSSLTGTAVTFTSTSGAPAPFSAIEAGDIIVAYGNTTDADRQNIIYRNVDASTSALIDRMQSGVSSYANFNDPVSTTVVARGDLNGLVTGISSTEYGIAAGDMTLAGNHFLFTENQASLQIDAFLLDAPNLLIDSTYGIEIGTAHELLNDNTFSLAGGVFSGDADSVLLTASKMTISTDANNIDIGGTVTNILIGRTNAGNAPNYDEKFGINFGALNTNPDNYWKYVDGFDANDNYVEFEAGDGTEFIKIVTAHDGTDTLIDLQTETARFTNENVTYGDVSVEETSESVSPQTITTGAIYSREITNTDGNIYRFWFDYTFSASGSESIHVNFSIQGFDGSTWTGITSDLDHFFLVQSSGSMSFTFPTFNYELTGTVGLAEGTAYIYAQLSGYQKYRVGITGVDLSATGSNTLNSNQARSYNPVTTVSRRGLYIRSADTLICNYTGLGVREIIDDSLLTKA